MKKKRVTRLLALALSFAMVVPMAACGTETGAQDEKEQNVTQNPKDQQDGEESGGQTEFTVWAAAVSHHMYTSDIANNELTQLLEKETGVHLDWTFLYGADAEDAKTKFNTMLAGGDLPDILLKNPFDRNTLYEAGRDGIVIPLNDLIEEHTVNMKKYFEEHPDEYESLIAPDGNIYGMGYFTAYHHGRASDRMWINQTWLDALGLKMPATTEEFYDTLVTFRDQDPNGNGEKDEVPLVNLNAQGLNFLLNAFCYYDGSNLEVDNKTVKFVSSSEEYREGLRYLAKLYKEGLLPQDVFSMDDQQISALCTGGVAGAAGMFSFGSFFPDAVEDTSIAHDMAIVTPLEGPDGVQQTVYSPMYPGVNYFSITSACEDPVAAIKWVDWFFDQDNSMTSIYGDELESDPSVEGSADYGKLGWWHAAEGELDAKGDQALYGANQTAIGEENEKDNYSYGMQITPWIMPEEVADGLSVGNAGFSWTEEAYYNAADIYLPYAVDKSYYNAVLFISNEGAEAIADYTQINSMASQWRAEFITGVKDLDADWDTYLSDLEALDLEGYLKVLQSEYENATGSK